MAKATKKPAANANPVNPAQASVGNVEAPMSSDDAVEKILSETPKLDESGEEIQATPAEGEDAETEESTEPAPEGGEQEETAEGETAAEETQEGEDPELEVLRDYANDEGQVDLKRLSKDISSLKQKQGQGSLSKEQEQDLRDMQHLKELVRRDPKLYQALQESDARARGVTGASVPRPQGVQTWDQVKAAARKLREEGKHEEAYELMRANDPELLELRKHVHQMSDRTAKQEAERVRGEKIAEYNKVEAEFEISDKVFNEMKRLCEEEGLGNRPVSTILKLASINTGEPLKKKNQTQTRKPIQTVNLRGRGVAKGGGLISRQAPAPKAEGPMAGVISEVASEMDTGARKLFGK